MDEAVDHSFPPSIATLAVGIEPAVVRLPMARLIPFDDAKDLGQHRIAKNEWIAEQDLDLLVAALLGQRDHPAQPAEKIVAADHMHLIEIVDALAEHDADEA